METRNLRPELHVAQQSRRDKLRVHQQQNMQIYSNHLQQHDDFPGGQEEAVLSPDLIQMRNLRSYDLSYEPNVFSSSEMLHFAANSPHLVHQVSRTRERVDSSFTNLLSHNINSSSGGGDGGKVSGWKNVGSQQQQNCEWVSTNSNNPVFVPQGLSTNSLTGPISTDDEIPTSQKQYGDNNMHNFYHSSWPNNSGNELLLLPTAYANFSDNKDYSSGGRIIANNESLSLSLSAVPSSNKEHERERQRRDRNIVSEEMNNSETGGCFNSSSVLDTKPMKSEYNSCLINAKHSHHGVKGGIENVDMVGNSGFTPRCAAGPLGPFTGYATILKSSKFLRPTQQLLDEICNIFTQKSVNVVLDDSDNKVSNEIRPSRDGGNYGGDSAGVSSSSFSPNNSSRPEYLQKKAKLLYMQDEVCRRYKHYHQQMQMVVSSFETVAGLSAATPYISLALKSVSRHFRCLRNAISDQLRNVRKAMGEELSSLTTGTSSSKGGDTSSSKQKLMDQAFQKQKAVSGGDPRFFEPQQHVWRPQRGLPERAVAILRAWLFDHFLHPYPTDADKHMLATQTGLTRNQVSNWFINARVRVWKPMVEEIHTLETKGTAETGSSSAVKTEGKPPTEGVSQSNGSRALNRLSTSGTFSDKQAECSEIGSSIGFTSNRMNNAETWNHHERQSRLDQCRIPGTTMDGSFMGFMPYQQSGIDMGGSLGLTLGLRQNAEGLQQHPLQQQENQLRRHFGDHIIYDFVG